MKITSTESFILTIPTENTIADSMQSVSSLEFVGIKIFTDAGVMGTGYTITVGFGGSVIKEVIDSLYSEVLIGEEPHNVKEIWQKLYYGKAHWIGRSGATTMAQSAIDIALWDIVSKAAEKPLWQFLGAADTNDIPTYNTHGGWLNLSLNKLVDESLKLLDQGYTALKIKVGLDDLMQDVRRIKAVKDAIGDKVLLMVDANQAWSLMQARQAAERFKDFGLTWLEEPMHPDDIRAHSSLHQHTAIPIALGEHVYSEHAFADFIERNAVDLIQVDVCRIGGITPWLNVAAMAAVANIRVCPHAGDLMQVHQHLVKCIPNNWFLEVIPLWSKGPFKSQIELADGFFRTPTQAGASTEFTEEAFIQYQTA